MTTLAWISCAPLVVLICWSSVFAAKDRAVILNQLWVAAVGEAIWLIQAIAGGILSRGGGGADDFVTWISYAIIALLMLPGAAAVAFVERTRYSSVVMVVVSFVMLVMQWRMHGIWEGVA
ncbi:hypothetical protein [Rarobacter incanus]|uniref:Uncharacterized protein n=1 Tax=Rarobacter incanus TaxID=153494 RepID=A0A542SMJ1_9MICO|nr:hypothetical protein [Rarobacter incanus]TQK75846.1 hypothetical protein FB389_0485 [Rarobacter incanus]